MKTWIIVLLGLAAATSVSAGDWETSADLGLNFSQSSYNDDWTGEEKGTLVWTFLSDVVAARATERADWKNTLKLKYGKTKTQDIDATSGERSWGDSEKSTDRIFFESLYKFTRTGVAEPFVALTLESQFDDGASHFLKPALWTESAGLGKTLAQSFAGRLRPSVGQGPESWGNDDATSFPSGHAINIFQLATVLSHHADRWWFTTGASNGLF